MEAKTVYVNLDYDEQTNSLPPEKWREINIHGLREHHNPANEAIGFALEMSDLDHAHWPEAVYTSLTKPTAGCQVTRHSLEIQS